MPSVSIVKSTNVKRTPRVMQVEGIFDIPPSERSEERWEATIPTDERNWNVGLICGPSGSGKSTVAKELFGNALFNKTNNFVWNATQSLLDDFPKEMSIKDITSLLSSVGFSSAPLWVRPFSVLSTGQQMRVTVARLLAEQGLSGDTAVMDEFTSVVDRQVAQIGSAAIAKTVRARNQKFVAVSCHYDVLEWLQPDWVFEPHTGKFEWRLLRRKPEISLTVRRVHHSAWEIFRPYHYLNHTFNKSARLFVAFLNGEPVAMQAVIVSPHPKVKNLYRGHRAVCLPDYQGVGIGNALIDYIGSAYRALGNRILSTTASPALIKSRSKNPNWKLLQKPHLAPKMGKTTTLVSGGWETATNRLTTTWEYIGPTMDRVLAQGLVYE